MLEARNLNVVLQLVSEERKNRVTKYDNLWNGVAPVELKDGLVLPDYGYETLDNLFQFFFKEMLAAYLYYEEKPEIALPCLTTMLSAVESIKYVRFLEALTVRKPALKRFVSLGMRLDQFVKITFEKLNQDFHVVTKTISHLESLEDFKFEASSNPTAFPLMPLSEAKSRFRLHLKIGRSHFRWYMHELARYSVQREVSEKLFVHFKASYGWLNSCERQITRALLTNMASYGINSLETRLSWKYDSAIVNFYENFNACSIIPEFGQQDKFRYS